MSYVKQDWKDYPDTTTPINSTRLNHMEDGISAALTEENITNDINDTNENAVVNAKTTKDYVDEKNTYSTDEKIVGTWIDGKPIYRKVINTITGDKFSAWKTILSEVDKVVRYNGFVYETETDIKVLPYAGGLDGGSLIWFHVNATSHVFQEAHSDDMFNSKEMTIIVEYTKTTDL